MGRFFTVEMEIINCDGKEPLIKVVDDFSCQLRIQFFFVSWRFKKSSLFKKKQKLWNERWSEPGLGPKSWAQAK